MSYSVQFVGLVCFYREHGSRLALLPDGRDPGDGIAPHQATIIIEPTDIESTSGWEDAEGVARGNFTLSPCEIVIAGADAPGTLDTSAHDGLLPQLRQIDPNFEIDPARAQTVAKLRIQQGTLTAYQIPGGSAVISQLDVPHEGSVRITVKPDDGSAERTIVARPGAEIAVANMARAYDEPPSEENGNHFKLYERLSSRDVTLTVPRSLPDLPGSSSRHVLFSKRRPVGLYVDCTNTGCC